MTLDGIIYRKTDTALDLFMIGGIMAYVQGFAQKGYYNCSKAVFRTPPIASESYSLAVKPFV